MDPDTSEATARQLDHACEQGEAYGRALRHMTQHVAHDGGEQSAGPYLIGYAVEEAEGMYAWDGSQLVWQDPGDCNLHLEVSVRDGSDGRFVPGVNVRATLIAPDGREVGTHEQPLIWHPMLYHYGRNWQVPADGEYRLIVRVEPPAFLRHDEVNGRRFTDPVEAEFAGVSVRRGSD
jgi:Fe2+ transport protein